MRKLKITGCSDGHMWYAGLVGQVVPLLREEHDVYLSREPAGYTNIVRKPDAKPVWVDLEGNEYGDGDTVRCACKQAVMRLSRGVSCCSPIDAVPVGSRHSVALCTFDPESIGTNVQMPQSAIAGGGGSFSAIMQGIGAQLERGRALLKMGSQ